MRWFCQHVIRCHKSIGLLVRISAALLLSASIAFAQDDDVEVIPIEIIDAGPTGLADIASIFPFVGPFGPDDDGPGDRFLHDMFDTVNPVFAEQLLQVIQSRFPTPEAHPCYQDVHKYCPHADSPLHCLGKNANSIAYGCAQEIKNVVPFVCAVPIHRWCGDNLESGVIPCLESRGSDLGQDCADAIVATKHALAGISQRLKANTGEGADTLVNDGTCPRGFYGPSDQGCCVRRWSRDCDAQCSQSRCEQDSNWEWQWADFRVKPYTCCPKSAAKPGSKYIGGQALCPTGWYSESQRKSAGHCCRRPWSWECGEGCAQSDCDVHGWSWWPVDVSKEHYKCCPEAPPNGPDESTGKGTGKADASSTGDADTSSDQTQDESSSNAESSSMSPMDLVGYLLQPTTWALVFVLCLVRRMYNASQADNKDYSL